MNSPLFAQHYTLKTQISQNIKVPKSSCADVWAHNRVMFDVLGLIIGKGVVVTPHSNMQSSQIENMFIFYSTGI